MLMIFNPLAFKPISLLMQQVQAELERKQAAEEEREKAVQKQQQDIAALQQEVHSRTCCLPLPAGLA